MPDGKFRGIPKRTPSPIIVPPDRIYSPLGTEVIADEFDDGLINAAWTRVDASSASYVTWTETQNVMSASHTSSASGAGYWHGLMRPLNGLTFPVTIETHVRGLIHVNVNYLMIGTAFSNGVTPGAGKQCVTMPYMHATSYMSMIISMRDFSNWNSNITSWQYGTTGSVTQGLFIQHVWTAANTFMMRISVDGVSWIEFATQTMTLTPTYVGIIHSNWGGAYPYHATWEYFRVYNQNPVITPGATL